MQRAQTLVRALEADERAQLSCRNLNEAAFQHFLGEASEALEEERRHLRGCHAQSWREWVKEAEGGHTGWAHKWTPLREHWRPVKVTASSPFTGRPRDALLK